MRARRFAWRPALLGMALILFTNVAIFAAVGWNRSAVENSLILSTRELQLRGSTSGWLTPKDSAIALRMDYRFLHADADQGAYPDHVTSSGWLDEAALRALGFVLPAAATPEQARRRQHEIRSRHVWLALELDGPAYRTALNRAEQRREAAQELAASRPDDQKARHQATQAEETWLAERDERSRLFVIDAASDAKVLRTRYPNRHQVVIISGWVGVRWTDDKPRSKVRYEGYVERLDAPRLHVPRRFHAFFADTARAGLRVTVAWGKNKLPWIADVEPAGLR